MVSTAPWTTPDPRQLRSLPRTPRSTNALDAAADVSALRNRAADTDGALERAIARARLIYAEDDAAVSRDAAVRSAAAEHLAALDALLRADRAVTRGP